MDCGKLICLVPLDPGGTKIFGFGEYLAAMALIILAWTTADYRYKFRIETAWLDVRRIAFGTVTVVGVLTLATDLWRASSWPVPAGSVLSPATWQGLLGFLFLGSFGLWSWVAFIRPPRFGSLNCDRFAMMMAREVHSGDTARMTEAADALTESIENIVRVLAQPTATQTRQFKLAESILSYLSDRTMCRVLVTKNPAFLAELFHSLRIFRPSSHHVQRLIDRIEMAAINEEDSFLHREGKDQQWLYLSASSSITNHVFGDIKLLDAQPNFSRLEITGKLGPGRFDAMLRAFGAPLADYAKERSARESQAVIRIFNCLDEAIRELQRGLIQDPTTAQVDELTIISMQIHAFTGEILARMARQGIHPTIWRTLGARANPINRISDVHHALIYTSSLVTRPAEAARILRQNVTWTRSFANEYSHSPHVTACRKILLRSVLTALYGTNWSPLYTNAHTVGYLIGLVLSKKNFPDTLLSIQGRVLLELSHDWIVRHYDWLHTHHPSLAKVGLTEDTIYEASRHRIARLLPITAFRPREEKQYLDIDPFDARRIDDHYYPDRDWGRKGHGNRWGIEYRYFH